MEGVAKVDRLEGQCLHHKAEAAGQPLAVKADKSVVQLQLLQRQGNQLLEYRLAQAMGRLAKTVIKMFLWAPQS